MGLHLLLQLRWVKMFCMKTKQFPKDVFKSSFFRALFSKNSSWQMYCSHWKLTILSKNYPERDRILVVCAKPFCFLVFFKILFLLKLRRLKKMLQTFTSLEHQVWPPLAMAIRLWLHYKNTKENKKNPLPVCCLPILQTYFSPGICILTFSKRNQYLIHPWVI